MNLPVRIGILGTAAIAKKSIIPAIQLSKEKFRLTAIASREHQKAKELAGPFGAEAYGSYEELLSSGRVDAVYIPLPNGLHEKWVRQAMENGIHVLVEKSLGCSFPEVEKLVQLAEKNDVVLVENFQFRFHNQLAVIKDILANGRIGELRCIRASLGFPPFQDQSNIRYQRELGGGALLDAGAYPIKLSQIFLGEDIVVSAARLSMDPAYNVDTWGGGFLQQRTGNLFAEIAFGFDNFYQCSVELWGSKGKLFTNRIFTAHPDYTPELIIEDNNGLEKISLNKDNHFVNMLAHFFSLVNSESDRQAEYRQNINQARLIQDFKKIAHA